MPMDSEYILEMIAHRATIRFGRLCGWLWAGLFLAGIFPVAHGDSAPSAGLPAVQRYRAEIAPLLEKYCADCHADGAKKGNVAFDEFKSDEAILESEELWHTALRYVRAGVMPPANKKSRPTAQELALLEGWIKKDVLEIDPANVDPGRVTVRRLNRTEYRNTVRDLTGVDFNTDTEFPPDDTGHGFDNIGDVLNISPMLLEKYLVAARGIISDAVPTVSAVVAEKTMAGRSFREPNRNNGFLSLPYYEAATVTNRFEARVAGTYEVALDLLLRGNSGEFKFDSNRCEVAFLVNGKELMRQEHGWYDRKEVRLKFEERWSPGEQTFTLEVRPLTTFEKSSAMEVRLNSVAIRGPLERENWIRPKNYERFFTGVTPEEPAARRAYAAGLLRQFATRAFRRPPEEAMVERLTGLAESVSAQPGKTFEAGVAHAMIAVLASPRFLFREEASLPEAGGPYPLIDEYSLASRLSYFLWSSMPDDALFELARSNQLRAKLPEQFRRMLEDSRSGAFMRNFVGQWLQTRDIEGISIDERAVFAREDEPDPKIEKMRARFRELRNKDKEELTEEESKELDSLRAQLFRGGRRPRAELNGDLRQAMRQETERTFAHILKEDRSLIEMLDADYAILNERLAKHYGIPDVTGDDFRLVKLPPDSPRGGVLTQGTILAVTSNPTRTSPVKRGLFVLENILGMPPAPPPPDIPALEDAARRFKDRQPTLRETLALHREQPLCASCHDRMDPLGLALENFNALGMWREKERTEVVDPSGQLITGEKFATIQELKQILAADRPLDFYRCLTEKLLTYALGRGLEPSDLETVDRIVDRIVKEKGRASALLTGILESAPFQRRRDGDAAEKTASAKQSTTPTGLN